MLTLHLILPVDGGIRIEKIRICYKAWPHFTDKYFILVILKHYSVLYMCCPLSIIVNTLINMSILVPLT